MKHRTPIFRTLKSFMLVVGLILLPRLMHAQYVPDILGNEYVQRTFHMGQDDEGEVISTLVKRSFERQAKTAVLYLHGYNDYFFQKELGDSIAAWGYRFYALDLRKYGRSLRPHQDAFYCESLREYFADIDTALTTIRKEGAEAILLMGHSTGGLIATYYLQARQASTGVRALILNSPFLDWNFGWFMEEVMLPTVACIGKWFPRLPVSGEDVPNYAFSLLRDHQGEWTFLTNWKMPYGHTKRAGWIRAIQEAQQRVQNGKRLQCPVLVLSSDHSLREEAQWKNDYLRADIVLDVEDIRRYGEPLSPATTYHAIPDGMHDLVLSNRTARQKTYRVMHEWMAQLSLFE